MSSLLRSFQPIRSSSRALFYKPTASFHTSTARYALSESDSDQADREGKIEHHKQDSINRAKSGAGEWKPELASSSEQSVKSDKNDMTMEEMQKLGEQKAEEGKTPSGSSSSNA